MQKIPFMRILVTGGAGFIGSHLCKQLLSLGHKVLVADNFDDFYAPYLKEVNVQSLLASPDFSLCRGDIRDRDFLNTLFLDFMPEMVYHLAARAGVRPSIAQPHLYYDVNVNGTLCLLETMQVHGVRKLVFASSSSVYGNNKKTPFAEDDNVDFPISPYAATKKSCELLCHTWHHLYGFDIFCMRFFTVYGPAQRPEMAISLFTQSILEGTAVEVYGDGSSQRDYTYIDDIVSGLTACLPVLKGFEIINLGESQTISLAALIQLIEKACEKKAVVIPKSKQAGDVDITFADIRKARAFLGYHPQTKIEEGVKHYVNWYKKAKQS